MIKLQNVTKNYPGFSLSLDLSIKSGTVIGLIGQNGAGKSTAFHTILGLITPESGEIRIFDKPLSGLSRVDREKIGVVLADSGFSGYLTLKDVRAVLKNLYSSFDAPLFDAYVTKFSLPTNRKLKDMSTGMKARVKLISALTHNASLLILDEPTAGLDVIARDDVLDLLRDYIAARDDRTILISSHISTDLAGLCDEVCLIDGGRVLLREQTDVILDAYGVVKVDEKGRKLLDTKYVVACRKEWFGYSYLTDQIAFYTENAPFATIEKATIDDVLTYLVKGERL